MARRLNFLWRLAPGTAMPSLRPLAAPLLEGGACAGRARLLAHAHTQAQGGEAGAPQRTPSAVHTLLRYSRKPHSKALVAGRRERPLRSWPSLSGPALAAKWSRAADRAAMATGADVELAEFDAAAAGCKKPSPLVAAVIVERPPVVMRSVPEWERAWMDVSTRTRAREAKAYPPALLEMFTAATTVVEKGGASASSAPAAGGDKAAAGEKSGSLGAFYDQSQASARTGDATSGMAFAPRVSSADKIGDVRSLDRKYDARLVLLVRERARGWTLPHVRVRTEAGKTPTATGEQVHDAAERAVSEAFGPDPSLDFWMVGRAPIGHQLLPNAPSDAAASGEYGRKVFYYRAEIVAGRFRLPKGEPGDSRDAATYPYDDFAWVTRDEAEAYLPRSAWKYLHQIMGAGPGEEAERHERWLKKLEKKSLTMAQATGRRAFAASKVSRLPFVVTQKQLALANTPPSADKNTAIDAEWKAQHARRRAIKQLGVRTATALALPSAEQLFRRRVTAAVAAPPPATSTTASAPRA